MVITASPDSSPAFDYDKAFSRNIGWLTPAEQARLRDAAYTRMYQSGAHYVVDSIADIRPCIDDIEARLARGERP